MESIPYYIDVLNGQIQLETDKLNEVLTSVYDFLKSQSSLTSAISIIENPPSETYFLVAKSVIYNLILNFGFYFFDEDKEKLKKIVYSDKWTQNSPHLLALQVLITLSFERDYKSFFFSKLFTKDSQYVLDFLEEFFSSHDPIIRSEFYNFSGELLPTIIEYLRSQFTKSPEKCSRILIYIKYAFSSVEIDANFRDIIIQSLDQIDSRIEVLELIQELCDSNDYVSYLNSISFQDKLIDYISYYQYNEVGLNLISRIYSSLFYNGRFDRKDQQACLKLFFSGYNTVSAEIASMIYFDFDFSNFSGIFQNLYQYNCDDEFEDYKYYNWFSIYIGRMLGSGQAKEFLKYLNELVNSEDSYFPDYERFVLTVTDFLKFLYIPKVRMKMFAPILDKFKYFFDIEPENSNHIENMIVENLFRICRCEDSTVDFDHVFHQIVKRACAYQFTDLEAMSKFLDSLAPEITFDSDMIIGLLLLNDIDADDCIGKMLDCLHIPTLFVNIINDVIQIDYDGSKFARIIARLNSKRLSPEFIKYSVDVLESKAEELYKNDYNFLFFFMALDELLGKDCFDVFKRYLVLDFGDLTMDMILKIYNDHNINDIELYKCLFDTFSKFFITKPSEIFSETQREDILYNLRVSS